MVALHAAYVRVHIIGLTFVCGGVLGVSAAMGAVFGMVLVTDLLAVLQVLFQVVIVVLHDVLFLLTHGNDCRAGA